eukprot:9945264-Ditylum_brightwellii.AAC.1
MIPSSAVAGGARSSPTDPLSWNIYFPKLVRFHNKHGHCLIPPPPSLTMDPTNLHQPNHQEDYYADLREWVSQQRMNFYHAANEKKAKKYSHPVTTSPLSSEQVSSLKALGFIFKTTTLNDSKWMRLYEDLASFYTRHNHCWVPKPYNYHPELTRWVQTQRKEYILWKKEGKKAESKLTEEKVRVLDSIHFEWEDPFAPTPSSAPSGSSSPSAEKSKRNIRRIPPLRKTWDESFADLEVYMAMNDGDCSGVYDADIERWVMEQRHQYQIFLMHGSADDKVIDGMAKHHQAVVTGTGQAPPPPQPTQGNAIRSTLTYERVGKLFSLGFIWDPWRMEEKKE